MDAATAALPDADRGSPRRVLHAVAAAIAEHVTAQSATCRVLMEARALAAHEPAIAAAVRAADARAHERLEGLKLLAFGPVNGRPGPTRRWRRGYSPPACTG